MKNLLKIALTLLIGIVMSICIFRPGLLMGTPASPAIGNWYQQFIPNIGSRSIQDIIFLDSLNGLAIASRNVNPDTSSILRTTNGGDNWQIVQTLISRRFSRIKFINSLTGFISGGSGSGTPYLYKTIDGGNSWNVVTGATLGNAFWSDMAVLGEDTIWLVDANSLNGGVYFTSSGGANWIQQYSAGSQNPEKIYMYNARIGFISDNSGSPSIRKTTNGGLNWNLNVSGQYYRDITFTDSLTGWYSFGNNVYKTTNGGTNWQLQVLPFGGNLISVGINEFSAINKDTLFAVGAEIITGMQSRGIIYRTVNGGVNWTFQIPDTSIYVPGPYNYIQFTGKNHGWAYTLGFYGGIHTTTGGDPVWITAIEQISSEIPKDFMLYQNYPNPFNPKTNIKYSIMSNVKGETSNVSLIVYDITGREIEVLATVEQSAGTYLIDWNASAYSSGIYFYKLTVTTGKEVFTETKKMILIK